MPRSARDAVKAYKRSRQMRIASRATQSTIAARRASRAMRIPRQMPARLTSFSGEIKALVVSSSTGAPGGAALACNNTGSIIPLNLIQAGSSFFNRIGRKIEMKSLLIELNITPVSAARSTGADTLRILVIYDRQTNGAVPAISDILQDTEQNGTNTTVMTSNINLNNRDRFQIIRDVRVGLPAITNAATGVPTAAWPTMIQGTHSGGMHIREYIKLGELVTQYKADSSPAVIGDIATGGLFLITFSGFGAGTEGFTIAEWNARLRYHDN